MQENKVLATVEGVEGVGMVEITEQMAKVFAKRHETEYTADNLPGILSSIAGYVTGGAGGEELGQTSGDSFLFQSPETREMFAPVRRAFEARTGKPTENDADSNVSIVEVIPDWASFKETL